MTTAVIITVLLGALKSLRSDEDYYMMKLNEKLINTPWFCGYCEDPELLIPINSLHCAKYHSDVHCKCENRRKPLRKSKSLPDICYVVDNQASDHLRATITLQCQQRQESFESTDIEKITYSTETIAGTKLPPKLEEFIPNDFLTDILLVNDDDDCTIGKQGLRGKTQSFKDRIGEGESQRRYHRVLPSASHTGILYTSIIHLVPVNYVNRT